MTAKTPAQVHQHDTMAHIRRVRALLRDITRRLTQRGQLHDASKLKPPERAGFAKISRQLASVAYMSPEYRQALQDQKSLLAHHYQANSHHPEHYPDGIAGMSLLDIVEMLADWKAASERAPGGSLGRSLTENIRRFGIDGQLAAILTNTIRELDW